ncbi:MAG TPA: sigma-70 family RNA polymerase sigma factor [Gemmatimonadaceae bacterium]|nr:sigma-70 family RNA polymerase sigma factor [Gemmatimonadaceae bacterium]
MATNESTGALTMDGAAGIAMRGSSKQSTARERRKRFEGEVLEHLDAMYSFALKLSRSRDEAQDLVSETVLRALERWEQYQLGTNARAWLFTILYRIFVSRKRRIDARELPLAEESENGSSREVVGDADPEGHFYDSFVDEEVTRAIDELPEEYRTAVVLSDLHGLRYAEIAAVLDIPEGTVKSRLFRGRRILQKKLVDYALEMGYIKQPPALSITE